MNAARSSRSLIYLSLLLAILMLGALACGVKSGNRRGARPTQTVEFHRSPVTAFEQYRIDVTNDDTGCTSNPADVTAQVGQRIRFAIQLVSEGVAGGAAGTSAQLIGESQTVTYSIPGLEMSGSGGAFSAGVTSLELQLTSGNRASYDFNVANAGSFDILCDGVKIGTFTSS